MALFSLALNFHKQTPSTNNLFSLSLFSPIFCHSIHNALPSLITVSLKLRVFLCVQEINSAFVSESELGDEVKEIKQLLLKQLNQFEK